MQVPKPSETDRAYFQALVPADPRVDVKPMFGNLGAFVNGNMFCGLFGSDVGVKLPDEDRERLLATGGGPFGPAERPMTGYVALPPEWRHRPAEAEPWVASTLDHVGALPPKGKKPRR